MGQITERRCAWCAEPAKSNGKCSACQREYMRRYRASARGKARTAVAAKNTRERREARDPGYQARATAAWRASNPGAFREQSRSYVARRRARQAGATVESFSYTDMLEYWDSIGAYRCVYCYGPFEHIDHVLPLSKGGAHVLANLLPACASCNLSKGDQDPWAFVGSLYGADM